VVQARDPWPAPVGLREVGPSWAGGDGPTDPRLSTLNGPLTGLAPLASGNNRFDMTFERAG
jgi:monoterpene epsilon-lactone hydrolase